MGDILGCRQSPCPHLAPIVSFLIADSFRPCFRTTPKNAGSNWFRLLPAAEIQNEARLTSKPLEDVTAVCSALVRLCKRAVEAPKPAQPVAGALQTSNPSVHTPNPVFQTSNPSLEDPKRSNPATGAQGNPAGGGAVGVPGIVDPAVTVSRPFKTAFELDVPAEARKAFDSGKFRERIAKNAQK
jgi:hypothetical protein